MSGSNYAGRLGRIDRRFAEKLEAEGEGAGDVLQRFLGGLDLEDLRRLEEHPPQDARAVELQARFLQLWNQWGHDPAERRRRAENRARLIPLLRTLSPDEYEIVKRNPARLVDLAT
jgi:hypothetical protein